MHSDSGVTKVSLEWVFKCKMVTLLIISLLKYLGRFYELFGGTMFFKNMKTHKYVSGIF